jgi:hypothetical protein
LGWFEGLGAIAARSPPLGSRRRSRAAHARAERMASSLTPARASDTVTVVKRRAAHRSSPRGVARLRGALAMLLFLAHVSGCGRLGFEALERDALDASTDAGLDARGLDAGGLLPDGAWVADLPEQVADGSFFRPIHTTARGARVDGGGSGYRVWTGDNGFTCADWTSETELGDQHWIPQWRRLSDGELPCSGTYRLFCFERGHLVAAPRPPITGPRIFVTRALWTPNAMGLASADALCASEAAMAGLGPSRALLPTTTEAALDRTGRRSYQRVDGFPIGIPGSELTQEGYVVLDAMGAAPTDTIGLWTGGEPDAPSPDTCSDWTSTSGEAREGPASDWPGFLGFPRPFSSERPLLRRGLTAPMPVPVPVPVPAPAPPVPVPVPDLEPCEHLRSGTDHRRSGRCIQPPSSSISRSCSAWPP